MTCALFSTVCLLQAQITLNQASYTSTYLNTTDSFLGSVTGSTFPNFAPATNGSWDMTNAVSVTKISSTYHGSAYSSGFSTAQYADGVVASFPPFTIPESAQYGISSTGFLEYGLRVERQPHQLTGGGFTATDSLVFDAQNIAYSNPRYVLKFPATYQSAWTSTYQTDFNFHLTVAAYSINDVPGYQRQYVAVQDSVIGWGQMKVKKLDGTTSGYVNVLQVKRITMFTDSFFLGGAVAPSQLTAAFGVSQGQSGTTYRQLFFRPNEVAPFASVNFTDATYNSPSSGYSHAQQLPTGSGVRDVLNENNINIYPNPVEGSTIYIDIPNVQDNKWSYDLIDITGKSISSGKIAANQIRAEIMLPSGLANGIYYISLKNNEKQVLVKPLDIRK